jgi:predicted nuclease of predicted toxin-antitoxin system
MRLVLDMNLPPSWCDLFAQRGHDVVHWTQVGEVTASDRTLMSWAQTQDRVVVTYDLDFGALLASTNARGPSVVLIRAGDVLVPAVEALVAAALVACAEELRDGAIVTVDSAGHRVRALPLKR